MKLIIIAMLVSVVYSNSAPAQNKPSLAVPKTGDSIPDFKLTHIINYKTDTARISDFRGKVLILDFWATWCGGCISSFPKLDQLKKEFKNDVMVLSITDEEEKKARPVVDRIAKLRKLEPIVSVTQDTVLRKYFSVRSLPHYVIIDTAGKILAIPNIDEINRENISAIINGKKAFFSNRILQKAVPFDLTIPLLANNHPDLSSKQLFSSTFTGPLSGYPSMGDFQPIAGRAHILLLNVELIRIYQTIYGRGIYDKTLLNSRIISNLKDSNYLTHDRSSSKAEYALWRRSNTYCYELIIPQDHKDKIYEYARYDLKKFTGIDAKFEKRKVTCLVLKRISTDDKIRTKGTAYNFTYNSFEMHLQNARLSEMLYILGDKYMYYEKRPIIDGTDYKFNVDLNITAKLSDWKELRTALKPYGLDLVEEEREIDMLILTN